MTAAWPGGFLNIPLCYLSLALCKATGLLFKCNSAGSWHEKG